jgi:hypothetical protein
MHIKGLPLELNVYRASEFRTNRYFRDLGRREFENLYLPESMSPFTDLKPETTREFISDDNRGAISTSSSFELNGTEFFLSIKGIGSTTSPYSRKVLSKAEIFSLVKDPKFKDKIINSKESAPRYITGESWLRGSPYGGQGLQHASTSMNASEMADPTSIHGFRIAPLVNIVQIPENLENEIKKIYWYRRFGGRIVQETRLVPSNVRIYFHSGSTLGSNVGSVFDLFGINSNERAIEFLNNFVKSGVAFLTLFPRSMKANSDGTFSGLDFYDVWLDKDAVVAPDGTIYFADLEGLEPVTVGNKEVPEKIEDQIFRSLYEFTYAYEQVDRERASRFGIMTDRKIQLEHLLKEALVDDEIVSLAHDNGRLELVVGNILGEERLTKTFPIINF